MDAAPDLPKYQGNRRKHNGGSVGIFGKTGRSDKRRFCIRRYPEDDAEGEDAADTERGRPERLNKGEKELYKNDKNVTGIFGGADQRRGTSILAVLSGSREKEIPSRVRIRPVELKGRILYQASSTVGTKVLHENYTRKELLAYMEQALSGDYSQLQVGQQRRRQCSCKQKGKQTIKVKPHAVKKPAKILSHNRVKQYILPEGKPVPFLVDLEVRRTLRGRFMFQPMININRSIVFWNL